MRKMDFLVISSRWPLPIAAEVVAHSPTPSMVSTAALVERRGVEGRSRVAQVMLAEQQPALVEIFRERPELVTQQVLLKQLFAQPERDRHLEGGEPARRHRDVGFQQPLEFEEWLVVEYDMVEFVGRDAGFGEAIGDRVVRERGVVLAAGETLLLRRRDDPAVFDQRGRAVVVEGGNAEDPHRVA